VDANDFIRHHPKEKDSHLYHVEGNDFYSFSPAADVKSTYEPILKSSEPVEEEGVYENVNWLDVEKYLYHPQKWYVRHVLGMYFGEKEYVIPESESFGEYEPGLEEYVLKQNTFEGLAEVDLKRQLIVPLHNFGKVILGNTKADLRSLKERMTTHQVLCREEQLGEMTLDLSSSTLFLKDLILLKEKDSEMYRLVHVSLSKKTSNGKYLFKLWLHYLWLRALGFNVRAYLETLEEDDGLLLGNDAISVEAAKKQIESIFEVYQKRREGFVAFHPKAIYKLKDDLESPEFADKLEKIVRDGGGYDADLDFSFRNDERRELWNEENVKSMIQKVWGI
jgi:hypothetical protein